MSLKRYSLGRGLRFAHPQRQCQALRIPHAKHVSQASQTNFCFNQ